jgi:hypothetical protein
MVDVSTIATIVTAVSVVIGVVFYPYGTSALDWD